MRRSICLITVAVEIRLDCAGGGGRLTLQLCRLVLLSSINYSHPLVPSHPSSFASRNLSFFVFLYLYSLASQCPHLPRPSLKFLSLSLSLSYVSFISTARLPCSEKHPSIRLSSTPATPQALLQSSTMSSSIIILVSFLPPNNVTFSPIHSGAKNSEKREKKIGSSPQSGKKWLQ